MTVTEKNRVKQTLIWFLLICFVVLVGQRRVTRKKAELRKLEDRLVEATVAIRRLNRNLRTLETNRSSLESELARAVTFTDGLPSADSVLRRIDTLQALLPGDGLQVNSLQLQEDRRDPFSLRRVEIELRGRYTAMRRLVRAVEANPSLGCVVERLELQTAGTSQGAEIAGRLHLAMRRGWSEAAAVDAARRKKG